MTPSGDNLISLGLNRAQLIINSLDRVTPDSPPQVEDVALLYTKVSSSYVEDCPDTVKQAVETTLGSKSQSP